jgi:hypothetical protein
MDSILSVCMCVCVCVRVSLSVSVFAQLRQLKETMNSILSSEMLAQRSMWEKTSALMSTCYALCRRLAATMRPRNED